MTASHQRLDARLERIERRLEGMMGEAYQLVEEVQRIRRELSKGCPPDASQDGGDEG